MIIGAPVTPIKVTIKDGAITQASPLPGEEVRTIPEGEPLPTVAPPPHRPIFDPVFQGPRAQRKAEAPETTEAVTAPIVNVAGLTAATADPPDTTGEVGLNHFVQMVNATTYKIWNKAGTALTGTLNFGALWTPAKPNSGDPIVVYDQLADRWILSQFQNTATPSMTFAVSQTADPTAGTWYLYEFFTGSTLPDYPKIGVWQDAYYMSSYEPSNLGIYAFDRAKMLTGSAAGFVKTTISVLTPSSGIRDTRILPVDLDGPAPPSGTPGYFVRTVDGQQDTSNPTDRIEVYEARVNWTGPTFTFPLVNTLTPAAFNIMVGNRNGGGIRDMIPQPNTTSTVDGLSNRPMMQLRYRYFGGSPKMVFCQTIDISGSIFALLGFTPAREVAGIRWYELNKSGANWAISQQGTFGDQPGVTQESQLLHRWMGSAAINAAGDIAIGYSICNDDDTTPVYPGIRYTGRKAGDPVGTLPQGEGIILNGANSKISGFGGRWGDYSQLSVDPSDETTFWFTNHDANRATRIASFAVSTAPIVIAPTAASTAATTATLGGNVTSDGGMAITGRGVVYSITTVNSDPVIGGAGVTQLTTAGTTGVFTVNATGLVAGTGYSFKAYATNSSGTTYTAPVSTFTQGAPTVTTPTSASITFNSVVLGGNVTNDGGVSITERGVVYSVTATNNDPLIGGAGVTKVTRTGTTGVFTVDVSGLTASTIYSFKAYAINSVGTTYTSPVSSFATLPTAPTVTAPTSANVNAFNATLGGNVTSDGGAIITERGVVYSITATNSDPLIGGTGVTKVTGTGTTGVFTVSVSGLSQSTGYSFKAYATNSVGTSYTTPASTFTTPVAVPLTGTKTIGAGGNYTSLTNSGGLFDAINGNGVNGPLDVQIIGNLTAETGTVSLNAVVGTSPSVKIFPTGAARVISGSIAGALIRLNGADNVTLDGSLGGTGTDRNLTITNTSTTSPTVILLVSLGTGLGATNDAIKNCNISTGVATSIGYGISVGGSTPGTTGADNDNVTIQNNSITAAPVGIYAAGTSSASTGGNDNLSIIGNSVTYNSTLASIGIRVGNARTSSVSQNTVSEQTTAIQSPTAISIETGFVSSSVTRNTVTKSLTTNTLGYAGRGITVGTGTAASALTIANNVIYGVNGTNWSSFGDSSAMGIAIGTIGNSSTLTTTTGGISLYFNSVNMTGSMGTASTTAITTAIYIGSGASALDLRNNVFVNTQVGTSSTQKNYAIYSTAASTAFTTIDYNDYFVSNTFNAASAIPGFLTSDRVNLAAIQSGFGQNTHSFIGDPLFTSATDLHIASVSSPVSNTGTAIAGVPADFDGLTRSESAPDVGADEFGASIAPTVTTPTQTAITGTTATLGGNVTSDGDAAITERGVVYSITTTNNNPLIGGAGVTKVTSAGTLGIFTVNATGLNPGTGYSFKAYATNSVGTTYTTPTSTFTTTGNAVPTITGAVAGQAVNDNATISPFANVTIADPDSASLAVSVTLDTAAKGSFTTLNGFTNAGGGVYTFSGTPAAATTAIRGLVFTPTPNRVAPGSTETTTFTIGANDGIAATVTNNTTTVVATSINDAPGLDATKSPVLAAENEDVGTPSGAVGTLVASLVDFALPSGQVDNVTDADTGALLGIAITGTDVSGTWFFSTNGGTAWNAMGTLSESSARLLIADASTRIYFQPASNFNGTITNAIAFRAWDRTSGSNGGLTSTTSNGGTTAFSSTIDTASLTITAVNDAPVVAASPTNLSYTENQAATAIDNALTVGDVDSANLTGATVAISSNFASGQDVFGFSNQGGINGSYDSVNGVLTLTGTATLATYQAALRTVTYSNTSQNPSTNLRIVTFTVNDGAAANNLGSDTRAISVTAVNDAPVVTTTGGNLAYTENQTATAIDGGLSLSDPDNTNLASATVSVSANFASGQDVLGFTDQGGITGSYDPANGVLTLSGSASLTTYQTALRSVTYFNSSDDPSTATRTITFTGNEGAVSNNLGSASRMVSITAANDAPAIVATAGNLSYTENAAAGVIDGALLLTDADSANLTGATVTISANFASGEDVLGFTDQGGITGSYNAGVLTLSGSAAVATYQSALRSVTYFNSSDNPSAATRTITFTANDGAAADNLGSASRMVAITAVNDAPGVATTSAHLAYTENQAATAIDSALTLSDLDHTMLAGATVSITTNFANGQDVLGFATQGGITGSYDAANGILTLTGSASLATYETALRSVTYFNSSDDPAAAARTITFTADDGAAANHLGSGTRIIDITTVNDPPTLGAISDPAAIDEDAAAQMVSLSGISAGGGESQTLTVTATSDNPSLIPNPTVTYASPNATGSLSYTPVANVFGTATITVTVDDGEATDHTATRTFNVTVNPVNDEPSFAAGPNVVVKKSDPAQTVTGWAAAISVGPANESGQNPSFTVMNDNAALFSAAPAVAANGTLTFTPAPDKIGSATVTVTLKDDGGTDRGGDDTSQPQSFTITVTDFNFAPSFTSGGDVSVPKNAPAYSQAWAADVKAGPPSEGSQTVDFIVGNDNAALFSVAPAIAADGTLTFTPATDATGTANVTVQLHDNGGTDNGASNTSAPQTFVIRVTTFIEETGTYNGLALPAAGATPGAEKTGLIKFTLTGKGRFTGKLKLGAFKFTLAGLIDDAGKPHFGKAATSTLALKRKNLPDLILSLQLDVGTGSDQLAGEVTENGAPFATIVADRALYTSKAKFSPPFMNVPPALLGNYTVIFDEPVAPALPANGFPHGDGFGVVKVAKNGVAKITGTLADGSKVSYANSLSKINGWPVWVPFVKGTGALAGNVRFEKLSNTDLTGPAMLWFKPPGAKLFGNGWAGGITTDLVGSAFQVPVGASVFPDLGAADADGNAELQLAGGNLTAPGLTKALSIDPKNKVLVINPAADGLKVTITKGSGLFKGSFLHKGTGKKATFRGAILQKQKIGSGHFIGGDQVGAVGIVPDDTPAVP